MTPVQYIDNYTYTTKALGASAEHITIYDKLSDLTIEPGILYAYHHSGPGNSQKIIDRLSDNRLAKGLVEHRTTRNVDTTVVYDYDGPTHTMADGTLHTENMHSPRSYEVPRMYKFDNNSYGKTASISNQGSFTVVSWIHCTDWATPFGNQLIGNYTTNGFGIYNKDYIAPFMLIPSLSSVAVYNSDFKYIESQ